MCSSDLHAKAGGSDDRRLGGFVGESIGKPSLDRGGTNVIGTKMVVRKDSAECWESDTGTSLLSDWPALFPGVTLAVRW